MLLPICPLLQLPDLHLLHSVINCQVGQGSVPFPIVLGPDLSYRTQGCRRPSSLLGSPAGFYLAQEDLSVSRASP